MAPRVYTDLVLFRRLLGRLRPYWMNLLGIVALSFLAAPLPLLSPLPLKIAVDALTPDHLNDAVPAFLQRLLPESAYATPMAAIILAVVLFVLIGLFVQVHTLCSSLLGTYTGEKLVLSFRAELFRHVQSLSFTYHDSKGTTDTTYRIQYDASCIKSLV